MNGKQTEKRKLTAARGGTEEERVTEKLGFCEMLETEQNNQNLYWMCYRLIVGNNPAQINIHTGIE